MEKKFPDQPAEYSAPQASTPQAAPYTYAEWKKMNAPVQEDPMAKLTAKMGQLPAAYGGDMTSASLETGGGSNPLNSNSGWSPMLPGMPTAAPAPAEGNSGFALNLPPAASGSGYDFNFGGTGAAPVAAAMTAAAPAMPGKSSKLPPTYQQFQPGEGGA